MELNATDKQAILMRFPNIELSYETVSHKKVSGDYNLGMAISVGKKYFAWFTFQRDKDVCYLMELNKDKKISRIFETQTPFHSGLCLGTVFYGTVNDAKENDDKRVFFSVEDVYYYRGIPLKGMCFGEKIKYLGECFRKYLVQVFSDTVSGNANHATVFVLPLMWFIENTETANYDVVPENILQKLGYGYHHIQYRTLYKISPYLNHYPQQTQIGNGKIVNPVSAEVVSTVATATATTAEIKKADEREPILEHRNILPKVPYMDFAKQQYKHPAIFQVCADIQYDIYHLYAFGKNKTPVYYNVAYIPNYKTSVFMNSLFRNIRENINLDFIEESDDEEDFENMREDKYVNMNKLLNIECVFYPKFKKWVPVRVAGHDEKIVHISKL